MELREKFGEEFEIIVVSNGCSDGTVDVAKSAAAWDPRIRVVEIDDAVGKGGAVLKGLRLAEGEMVAFADADGATTPEALVGLFGELAGSDVVVGSRRMKGSTILRPQTLSRRLFGFAFAKTARGLFGLPYRDTQCGAKVMRKEAARQLCEVVSETRWTFDLDLLLCARRLGMKIIERPVVWADGRGSRLRYASTTWEVLVAFCGMKLRQRRPLELLPEAPILGEEAEREAASRELVPRQNDGPHRDGGRRRRLRRPTERAL
jgi:glycosyltransferase involved in cell wall biosynthesis